MASVECRNGHITIPTNTQPVPIVRPGEPALRSGRLFRLSLVSLWLFRALERRFGLRATVGLVDYMQNNRTVALCSDKFRWEDH